MTLRRKGHVFKIDAGNESKVFFFQERPLVECPPCVTLTGIIVLQKTLPSRCFTTDAFLLRFHLPGVNFFIVHFDESGIQDVGRAAA